MHISADGRNGGCEYSSDDDIQLWQSVAVTLAGPVAEARSRKSSLAAIYLSSGRHDVRRTSELMSGESIRSMEQYAGLIVKLGWSTIEHLAFALLIRGELDGSEVRQITGDYIVMTKGRGHDGFPRRRADVEARP